jgi:small subunit ribosomal protein S16
VATKIKLQRIGAKKKAFYRIVIADSRTARDGGPIELLGTYDPHKDPPEIKVDMDRVNAWISKGAQPTPKVSVILKWAGKPAPAKDSKE